MHSGMDNPVGLGCPIRRSQDHRSVTSSSGLIAGSNVLHRLSTPRHPPYALTDLIRPTRFRPTPCPIPMLPQRIEHHEKSNSRRTITLKLCGLQQLILHDHDAAPWETTTRTCDERSLRRLHFSNSRCFRRTIAGDDNRTTIDQY